MSSSGDISDDAEPENGPVVVGDLSDEPLKGEIYKEQPPARNRDHKRAVRRDLAMPIMWVLLAIYAVSIGGFVVARFLPATAATFTSTDLTAAIAGISGLQGLAAAIVGFFFGGKSNGNNNGTTNGNTNGNTK